MTTENSSQESVSTDSQTSDQTSSSSQSTEQTTQTASASDATANPGGDAVQAPVYQPNYKFKAFGKEHEIEETFRGLIKDKDTEEKVRKMHEKAYAMEPFQNEAKKTKQDFESFKAQTEPNMRAMNHFNNLLKNKDWDNFFGGLKIPDEELFNYVEKKLQLRALPPEQRAEFERQAQVRQQNYAYETQLNETQENYQRLATETRTLQLDTLLGRGDVSSQAEAIDKAYGEIGAFRKLVIEEAVNHYNRTQEDLPADQAVNLTLQKYGRFMQLQNQGAMGNSQGQPSVGSPQSGQQGKPAPIIPHVGGSARSPVKKQPRSLDDLKKMAKELSN